MSVGAVTNIPLPAAGRPAARPSLRIETRSRSALKVAWLRSVAEIESFADDWRALEGEVHKRTHLSTFDFLATWFRHYAGAYGGAPLVGVAWRGPRLVGVAPLTMRAGRVGGIPVTRVEFAPSDVPAGEFLVEDDHPETVAVLFDSLVHAADFDVMCLDGFDPASDELLALQEAATTHGLAVELTDHACARVDLHRGYQEYRAGLSGNVRHALKAKARRIAEAGGAVVGGIQLTEGLDAIEDCITRMIAINEASYKLNGQRLADNHRGFLSEVVRRFGARGMLSLPILSIGGKDAAFILGIVERGCFYDISLSYAEPFAKLSPGTFLMQEALKNLAEHGVHTVVSHGAHEYKKRWATAFVPQKRAFLFAPGIRGTAARFARFSLEPLWRSLRRQDPPHAD